MPQLATNALSVARGLGSLIAFNSTGGGVAGWTMLMPIGDGGVINTVDKRGPYRVADPAKLAADSLQAANGRLPIDENHATDLAAPNGGPSPARGWATELQARSDGIYGRVEWSASGAALMGEKAYRYISPVITHDKAGNVTGLLRASLTNTPNLRGMAALNAQETTDMDKLPELRAALGLPDDASIDDVLAKIRETSPARQSASPDPAKFVPISEFERVVLQVNELNQGISLQAATSYVAEQIERGNLLPYLKDWGVSLCSVNKPAFDAFISKTKKGLEFLRTPALQGQFNAGGNSRSDLSQDEIAIASNLGLTADAFLKSKKARDAAQEHDR